MNFRKFFAANLSILLLASGFTLDSAHAQSKSYKLGYKWAAETNTDTLIGYLIKNSFDLSGKPVRSKVTDWCDSMFGRWDWNQVNIQGKPASNKKDWVKGCSAKVMTYRFKSR
jgi:hypothetical protein